MAEHEGRELLRREQTCRGGRPMPELAAATVISMFSGRARSWNLRDRHMMETLGVVHGHLTNQLGEPTKIVVWAHNSHLGDARATEMAARGELSVGQLVRERHPDRCRTVGFTTYTGALTAADGWAARESASGPPGVAQQR